MAIPRPLLMLSMLVATGVAVLAAEPMPEWVSKIRPDHPRLFITNETFPQVKARALGAEKFRLDRMIARVEKAAEAYRQAARPEPRDLGTEAAWSAFIYLVTRDAKYVDLARKFLRESIEHYESYFEQRRTVNWYSWTRTHAVLAWDWLYNDLEQEERRELLSRMAMNFKNVWTVRPRIKDENYSDYRTGFYGMRGIFWYLGCTGYGTGIEQETINWMLVYGREGFMDLLDHRKLCAGDDGGAASHTLVYSFAAYPRADANFILTWLSSTGENLSFDYPLAANRASYMIWNWIAGEEAPYEFGIGDCYHMNNKLPAGSDLTANFKLYRQLWGDQLTEDSAFVRAIQQITPGNQWFPETFYVNTFLPTDLGMTPAAADLGELPKARHFENMGQVFMRSGMGPQDTYLMFRCGGFLQQHCHYDNLHFALYHKGFLALDTGTRHREREIVAHMKNYYSQTVAHNCVLIHQPDEPIAPHWGVKGQANYGGQHRVGDSQLVAFETNDDYTYVAGDATVCYQHSQQDVPVKCDLVTRQIVYLMPNHLVIFDRVSATDASYRKDWLLHTVNEPDIQGDTVRADHRQGRMLCRTLLPQDARLTKVGGPGKEFWAAGRNWPIKADGLKPEQTELMGSWRIEVTPAVAHKLDVFLHVVQVGDTSLTGMSPTTAVESGKLAGARLKIGADTWEVTFNTEGDLGGHIKRAGEAPAIDRSLTHTVQPQSGFRGRSPQ